MKDKYIVFDIDDTLVYEIDFLISAYKEISDNFNLPEYQSFLEMYYRGANVFDYIENHYGVQKKDLLHTYRYHFPQLKLNLGAKEFLNYCKKNSYRLGVISDGRSVTQRNKLKALQIEEYFDKIVISEEFGSEKPNENNYMCFMDFPLDYFYIGDNFTKDFITPNKLGWTTIAIRNNGRNIHYQNVDVHKDFLPDFLVEDFNEILKMFQEWDVKKQK